MVWNPEGIVHIEASWDQPYEQWTTGIFFQWLNSPMNFFITCIRIPSFRIHWHYWSSAKCPCMFGNFLSALLMGVFIRTRCKTFQNVFYSGLFQKPFTSSFYLDFFVYLELAFFSNMKPVWLSSVGICRHYYNRVRLVN